MWGDGEAIIIYIFSIVQSLFTEANNILSKRHGSRSLHDHLRIPISMLPILILFIKNID